MTIKILTLVIAVSTWTVNGLSQTTIDSTKISTEKELNFYKTDKRGIKADNGIIYLVETDGQTLTAYDKGDIKWTVNIIKACGEPPVVGKPEVRHIELTGDKIQVTFGKHSYASVDIRKGKVKFLGSD